VGLLGGSFNPAHPGHLHVAQVALRRLRLDQVWLLVSPGNPLKPRLGMAPLAMRLASAGAIADGRRVVATAIEARLHTRFTFDTLRALQVRFPLVRFVWLMGADNLLQLPRWQHWTEIVRLMPFAVIPRPGYNRRALAGQAAVRLRPAFRAPHQAPALTAMPTPAWTFLPVRQNALSATELRRARHSASGAPPQPALEGSLVIARKPPADPAAKPATRRPVKPAANLAEAAKAPGTPRKKAAVAGPRARAAKTPAGSSTARLNKIQAVIVGSLEDDKAEEIVTLDLAGRAAFTDRMVIATGLADRQISAMATHLEEKLAEIGIRRVQIEGSGGSDWVLIDAGDIVVHLFKPDARTLYGLERMWGAELDEPAEEAAEEAAGEAAEEAD